MNKEEIDQVVENAVSEKHHKSKANIDRIRKILNIIFMIGSWTGVILYFTAGHYIGIIVILASMVFKMAEYFIRFML